METVGFFGGDARMAYLARLLSEDGYAVRSWCLPGAPNEETPSGTLGADRIVLPVPLCREGKLTGTKLPVDELWTRLRRETPVYAGAIPKDEQARARQLGLRLTDYYDDEVLLIQNAAITAQGAVMAAMEQMDETLCGAPCLVLGFGRIGKLLARSLAALSARVTVSARSAGDLAWIEALGYTPLPFPALSGALGGFRAVLNTVPHPVLGGAELEELRRDCVLIELASADGMDAAAAGKLGLRYRRASGLPGRTAPETAARALRGALYRIWKEEDA